MNNQNREDDDANNEQISEWKIEKEECAEENQFQRDMAFIGKELKKVSDIKVG